MFTQHRRLPRILLSLFVIAVSVATANAGPIYKVIPIATPANWQGIRVSDINKSGQIVGYGFSGTITQPFIADAESFMPVPIPANFKNGFGTAINDSAQIAGWGDFDPLPLGTSIPAIQVFVGGVAGTVWVQRGPIRDYGFDINNSGDIVGHWFDLGPIFCRFFHAFARSANGTFRSYDNLPPINASFWRALYGLSVNNLGQVAGIGNYFDFTDEVPNGCLPSGILRIFLGDVSGVVNAIPVPTGWIPVADCCFLSTDATLQVNDQGQIAATVRATDGSGLQRAALSTTTNTFLIPPPNGIPSVSRPRLNNIGQVVGQIVGSPGGWIWDASNGTRLLQNLVPEAWTIDEADGINENGQILVLAHNNDLGFSGPAILDPDVTSPTIVPTVTGTLGNSGWYRSNVAVSWNVSDPVSGIASSVGCGQTTLSDETAGVSLSCSATNGAGRTSQVGLTIKIDKTAPAISGMPGADCSIWPPNGRFVQVATVGAIDAYSGFAALQMTGASNVQQKNSGIQILGGPQQYTVHLEAEKGRVYTLTASAADVAGNTTSKQSTCVVPHDQSKK